MTAALARQADQAERIHATQPPETAREALYRITALLRALAAPHAFNLSQPSSSTQSAAAKAALTSTQGSADVRVPSPAVTRSSDGTQTDSRADLHPLSTVCLPYVRRAIYSSLEVLKHATEARETWGRDTTLHLRRIRYDSLLRENATLDARLSYSICRNLAQTSDPFAPPYFCILNRLRHLAEHLKAITTLDVTEDSSHLTVCSASFLADFHFKHTSSSPPEVTAKLRVLLSNDQEGVDDNADSHLSRLVTASRFDILQRVFANLMRIEKLSALAELPLVDALRCFEEDLLRAASIERTTDPFLYHGHIVRTALGLRMQFSTSHAAFLGMEHVLSKSEISVARAQVIRTDPNAQCTFVQGKKAPVSAQYVLTLTSPIPAFLSVLHTLHRISADLVHLHAKRSSLMRASGTSSELYGKGDRDDAGKPTWPSLSDLVIPRSVKKQKVIAAKTSSSRDESDGLLSPALPDASFLQFQQNGMNPAPAMRISRIPLRTMNDIFPVLQLLRQQLVFNELFCSCVGDDGFATQSRKDGNVRNVEMVLEGSPGFMQFSVYIEAMNDVLSMVVHIARGGAISVKLKTASMGQVMCSDAKATQILRTCRSIPITLHTLISMSKRE
ncbi:Mediator of RNA polymerase 2 transcription subunit 1 [Gracilaria domingensis]|nr:Mediator of RNA polymerase 2 transcription subunit 1 [Gracilaria domingensis]